MMRTSVLMTLGLVLLLSACSEDPLPVEELAADEAGPATVQETWAEAEVVVLGEVTGHERGARIFGSDPAEDPSHADGPYYEAVDLNINVLENFKGQAAERLAVQWPAYVLDDASLESRRALLRVGGMVLDPEAGGTYLFFLKDYGGEFGLTGVSSGAGAIEIRGDRAHGEAGSVLQGLRGNSVGDIVDQAQNG